MKMSVLLGFSNHENTIEEILGNLRAILGKWGLDQESAELEIGEIRTALDACFQRGLGSFRTSGRTDSFALSYKGTLFAASAWRDFRQERTYPEHHEAGDIKARQRQETKVVLRRNGMPWAT